MELKRYDNFKQFIARAMGSILAAFLCVSGFGFRNVEKYTIHADTYTPVQKQSFVTWLLSYFGINIYTDAQQISDDLYTAVKMAYDLYLQTLQPQQQIGFDDIADLVTWDNARPSVLKLPGTVYNIVKGFANYISSQVYDPSNVDGLQIGTFETETYGSYGVLGSGRIFINNSGSYIEITSSSSEVRAVASNVSGNSKRFYFISLNEFDYLKYTSWGSSGTSAWYSINNTPFYYLDVTYDISSGDLTIGEIPELINYDDSSTKRLTDAFNYTFGNPTPGEATLNDVYALPEPSILDDLIGAADPESDMELDLDGSDIAYSNALTLEDIIGMINDAVNGYVLDDSYPDTAAKIAAQSQAIDNELTDVDYPNASSWEVPQTIATPQILPLLEPDCPDLSACLVAGIQDVGSSLGNVIDANSNVSNYVSVILFMGIALTILGGI